MSVTDEYLIREFISGDDGVFAGLYHRYKQPVFEFSVKMLGDYDEAGDVVQGVFLKVWERRDQLRQPERFGAWLMAMTRNECLTVLRKRKATVKLPEEIPDSDGIQVVDVIHSSDQVRIVGEAIHRLKPDLREVIILREYHDFSYREIGVIIGVDVDVVRSRLFSARQKIHEMLKDVFSERSGI